MRSSIGLVFLAVGVQATVGSTLETPIPGYDVVTLKYEVQAFPGGPKMNTTGTVEEVRHKLLTIIPNLDEDFNLTPEIETRSVGLGERFGPDCGHVHTAYGWLPASASSINDGIVYLRGISGIPVEGPEPGSCGRVSCSYDSAIWWCNDNPYTFTAVL